MVRYIATLYKSATGKGFGASITDKVTGNTWAYDPGWTREHWRQAARHRGYGRKGDGSYLLREVRYVSAYPQYAGLIASFDRLHVDGADGQLQLFAPLNAA